MRISCNSNLKSVIIIHSVFIPVFDNIKNGDNLILHSILPRL